MAERATRAGGIDLFISYAPVDERWATWIAWQLEDADYRTMLMAWDFVPGVNFIDFMDQGVRNAKVVIAILTPAYLDSSYGKLEWQTTIHADPDNIPNRLVPVLVEEVDLAGLLAPITYVKLLGVDDPDQARRLLLDRIRHALAGRAKPETAPRFPGGDAAAPPPQVPADLDIPPVPTLPSRRAHRTEPVYPPAIAADGERTDITVLHIDGPRFTPPPGEGRSSSAIEILQTHIWADLVRLREAGAPRPDLLIVTGDLTESGGLSELAEAAEFLTGLRALLGLEPHRTVVVPGGHDVNRLASEIYFATCRLKEMTPKAPYSPKWQPFADMFAQLYLGIPGLTFDGGRPWTLFEIPELRLVVAGLDSTMADSHRPEDHYGWVGDAQATWFAERLERYEKEGWLRLGAVRHVPPTEAGLGPLDPAAAEILRDGADLDRILGGHLHLLFHGAPPAGSPTSDGPAWPIGRTPAGLTTMPPSGIGGHQLVTLNAEGLTRWPGLAVDRDAPRSAGRVPAPPERLARRWSGAGATFPAAPSTTIRGTTPAPHPGLVPTAAAQGEVPVRHARTPADELLDRIEDVCRARHDRPRLRRGAGDPPHLWVTFTEDGVTSQHRIAAHVGTVDRAAFERFVSEVHAADPDIASELVYDGPQAPQSLRDEARRRGVRLRSFPELQGLLDLREFVARQTDQLEHDPVYPPRLHVRQRFRYIEGDDGTLRTGLTDELLELVAAEDGRFVLVLGDFGRGKTFALHEVARRIPTERPQLTPILLNLRSLDKAHSVEGLVAAQLARDGEHLPLRAFRYMLREGRIVLLFDGFDELASRVTYARATAHLDMLLDAMEGRAKVVVSSRAQHFLSDAQVLTALGARLDEHVDLLAQRRVLSIEEFSGQQIHQYLVNRYRDVQKADARLALIEGTKLLGLCHNPRMLSLVADIEATRLEKLVKAHDVVSAAHLYEEILETWMQIELERSEAMGGTPSNLRKTDLWRAVTTLALQLYESPESYLPFEALAETATTLVRGIGQRSAEATAGQPLTADETAYVLGAGTLLVRTQDGRFGFIHSSVIEWLVAKHIAADLSGAATNGSVSDGHTLLSRKSLSQATIDFLCDLADPASLRDWCEATLADAHAADVARSNALKVTKRVDLPAMADLRGVQLPGEDLSRRNLGRADLSDADLTDTLLVQTNLAEAKLHRARLSGANLDLAKLGKADLTGAVLERARLFGTDLRGVRIAGSRWRRAALVATTHDDELIGAPELRGAAIAPGQPVEVAFAPAVVSASYGFEVGRLPTPVAFTHDGATLAIGCDDGGVVLCDVATGLPVRTLRGHRGRVYAVGCGPDSGPLVTGAADRTVRLWDQVTGGLQHVLPGHRDWVWPIGLSPDGRLVAVGDASGTIRVWSTESGQVVAELPDHAMRVWMLRFSPDSSAVATGDDDGAVRIWEATTGALISRLAGPDGTPVYRVRFSPDGTTLVTGHDGGPIRLWDLASGTVRHELLGHDASVYTVDFHPSAPLLVSGDTRGGARLWDIGTGKCRANLRQHMGAIYHVRFNHSGDLLATCDSDGAARLWDGHTGELQDELQGHTSSVWPLAFSRDDTLLATASNDGSVRLWATDTGATRHLVHGHGRRVDSVRFGADGSRLAGCGSDGVVRLWHVATGECREQLTGPGGHLLSAVFSPRSAQLATAGNDGRLYLWNTDGAEPDLARIVNVDTDHIWATAFSPDADVVATANDDNTVRLRYASTGRLIQTLGEHRARVRSIEFHRTEPILVTGGDDQVVRIWDRVSGTCRRELEGHSDRVWSVDFSLVDGRLVSAGNDGLARVWDIATGEPVYAVGTPGVALWSAAFSPDGRTLVTAGDDTAVTFWDAATGAKLHELAGHTQRVRSVTFSPDGWWLASAGDDGVIRLWNLTGDEPALRLTLLGLPDGWAALAPDGRYKVDGDTAGAFWHVIGTRRFEPGELDAHLPGVGRLPLKLRF